MQKTLPEVFFEVAKKYPSKPALLHKREGVFLPITYKELSEKIKIFSSCLQNLGIEKGDKVAVLSENRPEWVISDLAIMSVGGITVPLHTTLSSKALCDILNHSEAKILIVSNDNLLHKILPEKNNLLNVKNIIFFEEISTIQKEYLNDKIFSFKDLLSQTKKNISEKIILEPDDVCSIIYTSGTTGEPKGVMLTHKNFLSNAYAINEVIPVKKEDVFLSFLPLSHVLERTAGYYVPLVFGACVAYAESSKQLLQNLKEVRPTILISVPRIFEKFHDAVWDKVNKSSAFKKQIFRWAAKQKKNTIGCKVADILVFKKIRKQFGGRLRLTISGGASLSENIPRLFSKMGVLILEGYGLTETSPVISANRENDFKFGTVGKTIPGVEIKVSESKEILIKGDGVFKGYFKDEEKTKESFDKNGWFCAGDLGFIDKQGFLTIIGRKKEMLVTSGGKNIWPEPIENLLNNDRFISQSVIIGNKRKFVSALIVPDWQEVEIYLKEKKLPLQERAKLVKNPEVLSVFQTRLDEKINPCLNDFERIKKFKLLPDELSQENDELTPTLKLRRHIVEKHCQKLIESMYA